MDRYRRLLERLDGWFSLGKKRFPGVIPCAAGCSDCCRGPFDISVADMALAREGVRKLPPGERAAVLERARASLARASRIEPAWEPPYAVEGIGDERFDALAEALHDEPCPLLDERGACRIYADRPLVCRLIGLSMRSLQPEGSGRGFPSPGGGSATRTVENCCPIQGRFPGYAALPPVEFDLASFEEEERECLREAAAALFGDARYSEFHSWIAGALVSLEERGGTDQQRA